MSPPCLCTLRLPSGLPWLCFKIHFKGVLCNSNLERRWASIIENVAQGL